MTFGHFFVILKKMKGEITMKKVELNKKKKQDALLNTAYQLFTEKGFQKTSISDIVNAVSYTHLTLPTNSLV